jgi:hypothetical protein
MKNYMKLLFSVLGATICAETSAADQPTSKKSRKHCPMNENKECNRGKECDCS